jgi:hypothetical protein
MEVIKNIAAIIGCILSVISLITLCTKGGRNFIKNIFLKNTKDLYEQNQQQTQDIEEIKTILDKLLLKVEVGEEFTKQQCRNILKDIYYKYQKDKKIPLYQRKTADLTYELYTNKYNGNSYATLLYKEICKWEIDTLSYQDLVED